MRAIWLVTAVGLGTPVPLLADDSIDCSKAANTLEMNFCIDQELKEADKRLNETYQQFIKTLQSMEDFNKMPKGLLVDSLRRAQREWISYRDRNCDFYSKLMYGGTAAATYSLSCRARMTKERLGELEKESAFWQSKGY